MTPRRPSLRERDEGDTTQWVCALMARHEPSPACPVRPTFRAHHTRVIGSRESVADRDAVVGRFQAVGNVIAGRLDTRGAAGFRW